MDEETMLSITFLIRVTVAPSEITYCNNYSQAIFFFFLNFLLLFTIDGFSIFTQLRITLDYMVPIEDFTLVAKAIDVHTSYN